MSGLVMHDTQQGQEILLAPEHIHMSDSIAPGIPTGGMFQIRTHSRTVTYKVISQVDGVLICAKYDDTSGDWQRLRDVEGGDRA